MFKTKNFIFLISCIILTVAIAFLNYFTDPFGVFTPAAGSYTYSDREYIYAHIKSHKNIPPPPTTS